MLQSRHQATFFEYFYGIRRCTPKFPRHLVHLSMLQRHLPVFERLRNTKIWQIVDILFKFGYITSDSKWFGIDQFLFGIEYRQAAEHAESSSNWLLTAAQLALFLGQSGFWDKVQNAWRNQAFYNLSQSSSSDGIIALYRKRPPRGICAQCGEKWNEPVALSTGIVCCRQCSLGLLKCPATSARLSLPAINLYLS